MNNNNLIPMRGSVQMGAPALPPVPTPQLNMRPILVEYLNILQRRKWTIMAVLAAALMAALVITLLTRPTYTATTQVQVSRDENNVTNVQGVESENAGRDLEFYQTQYELLEARSLAERVVRRLRLDSNDNFWAAHGVDPEDLTAGDTARSGTSSAAIASSTASDPRGNTNTLEQAAIATLLENIAINPIRGSALIDVDYSSFDPAVSAQVANAWVDEFVAQSIARKYDSTAEARGFLEQRLEELRGRVEESERALVDFATARNIVTITSDAGGQGTAQIRERTLAAENLQGLNQQLIEATGARIEAEADLIGSGSAQTTATLAALRERRALAASELAELSVQFEPGYPRVMALREQVATLDDAIASEQSRISGETRERLQSARLREADLRAQVSGLSGEVLSQRRDAIQYNIFQREADTNRQLYDSLLQRYKEIGVAGVSASNIAVIDRAQAPDRPSSPNLMLNLVFAMLVGVVGAAGTVFLLEQSNEGLTDPSKVQELLGIPLLGSVPLIAEHEDPRELVADPKTEISESYIAIRSALAFTTAHGVPKSFMLVSSQPSEGKSMSALALALVLGRMGKKVLLVDADLRNPSAHSYLGTHRESGLSNYLAGNDDVHALIQQVRENVDLLASGPTVPSAAELFSSDRLTLLIRQMEGEYDHVVVDSAPILGLADAPLVSQTVEAVLFVAEAGRVSARGLNSALERMAASSAPVVGAILTKLDQKSSLYGYGYSYSYDYTSSEERQLESA
ncbi:polysaccharide biosynthesis tyrosine autokinase [uncultured Erythrobacter sp.]|uniref:GumC family protein n=1 Tax=uncultured Erythrobacter sp. TaxID=263913 RepID=UPI002618D85B|nr:polysaccharide biosynthesis tyrosine autokinase [uncultured Erythrobacter sp.]